MKLFISADIEGCAGVALAYETHKNEAAYREFAGQMTREVVAACEAAHEAGADEIVVKDGHGDAANIDPLCMPDYVTLIRGKGAYSGGDREILLTVTNNVALKRLENLVFMVDPKALFVVENTFYVSGGQFSRRN